MTPDELTAHVQKEVHDHFKPKKPEPKVLVDLAAKKFFLAMMCQTKEKEPLSDYDRSITKSCEKRVIVGTTKSPISTNNPNKGYPIKRSFQKRMKQLQSLWLKSGSQNSAAR